jgi:hypothetical protein
MTQRMVLFVDWQNVYKGAREAFHTPGDPSGMDRWTRFGSVIAWRS